MRLVLPAIVRMEYLRRRIGQERVGESLDGEWRAFPERDGQTHDLPGKEIDDRGHVQLLFPVNKFREVSSPDVVLAHGHEEAQEVGEHADGPGFPVRSAPAAIGPYAEDAHDPLRPGTPNADGFGQAPGPVG